MLSFQNIQKADIDYFFKKFTEVARKPEIIGTARILPWFKKRNKDSFVPSTPSISYRKILGNYSEGVGIGV